MWGTGYGVPGGGGYGVPGGGGLECCVHAGRERRGGYVGLQVSRSLVRRRCNTTMCIGDKIYLPVGQSYIFMCYFNK